MKTINHPSERGKTVSANTAATRNRLTLIKEMESYHYTGEATEVDRKGVVRRVAAYCRVSTLAEEQDMSFSTQCNYYQQLIEEDPHMALVGIYGDHGISGLSISKRLEFERMMQDCMAGKIDMVMTKSISRFARNLSDCIDSVNKLRGKGIPVLFEREGLNSMDQNCEMILAILASIAQEEINSMSQNIRWAHERLNASGNPARCARYGYRKVPRHPGRQQHWLIYEPEAARVRLAFELAMKGYTYPAILDTLNTLEMKEGKGCIWRQERLREMLKSEVYVGDVLTNRSFTPDYITGKSSKNKGQQPQYYIEDHHESIVDRMTFDTVGRLIRCKALHSTIKEANRDKLFQLVLSSTFNAEKER